MQSNSNDKRQKQAFLTERKNQGGLGGTLCEMGHVCVTAWHDCDNSMSYLVSFSLSSADAQKESLRKTLSALVLCLNLEMSQRSGVCGRERRLTFG